MENVHVAAGVDFPDAALVGGSAEFGGADYVAVRIENDRAHGSGTEEDALADRKESEGCWGAGAGGQLPDVGALVGTTA